MDFPEASSSLTASGELNVCIGMEIKSINNKPLPYSSASLCYLKIEYTGIIMGGECLSIPRIRASLTFLGRGIRQRSLRYVFILRGNRVPAALTLKNPSFVV